MAATPNNANLRGGYDYSFVNTPPDELVCKICHHPSREPYLSVCCGHTFCKTCLDDAKRAVSVENACPVCREKGFTTCPNKQNERALKSLHVFCTNKNKGCDWQGELNSIVAHLTNSDGCPFEEVSCTNECGLSLQRQHLSKHIDTKCPRSKVTCQYCSIIEERHFITGKHHEEECPKYPLPCPNRCEIKTVHRENMEAHRAKCPLEVIHCECNLSLQRQFLGKHVDIECPRSKVACQYCNTIGERQFINGQHQKEECSKFPLSCPNNCKVGTVLRENMEAHRVECPLEMIQCEYYEMGCKDSMARKDEVKHNKEEVENHLSLVKSEHLRTKVDTEKTVTTTKNKLAEAENQLSLMKSEYLQTKSKLADTERTVTTTKNMLVDTEKTVTTTKNKLAEAENQLSLLKSEYLPTKSKLADTEKTVTTTKNKLAEAENQLSLLKSEYLQTKSKLADTEKTVTTTKNKLAETENQLSLMKSEYLQTKSKLADTEKTVTTTKRELTDAEKKIRELESSMERKIQLVENMMFKHVFQWYTTLEERVKSQHTKVPVTLKMSDYSKKKKSNSNWNSDSFSWELSLFDRYPELKLRVTPAGYRGSKGTHLSVQLYLVKGGCKKDFEHQIEGQLENEFKVNSRLNDLYSRKELAWTDRLKQKLEREIQEEKENIQKKWRKELREKQELWEKISLTNLHVMILNQITDSEHYSVKTNRIDLKADHFLTNKDCNVLIFDSPCFVSNEVLYKSTATCRYLNNDNVYISIKVA